MNTIDVIIPLYNGEKWIRQTIDSVNNQSLKPTNIILVDDGSTDSSVKCVKEYNNIQVVSNPRPGIPSRARNYGLTHSSATKVAFLDQDDIWHPNHLELLNEQLIKNKNLAAVASLFELFQDGNTPEFDLLKKEVEIIDEWNSYPFGGFMEPSLILFQRWIFDRVQWSDQVSTASDRFLWHQILVHHPIMRVYAQTVARRVHQSSLYHTMNNIHPTEHFKKLSDLSEKLICYRREINTNKKDIEIYERRSKIMGCIADLIEYILENDVKLFKSTAINLNNILTKDNLIISQKTFEQLFLYLGHFNAGLSNQISSTDIYFFICNHWPKTTSNIENVIFDRIIRYRPGLMFYLNNIIKNPFTFRWYNLFGQAIVWKLGLKRN